jgi:hypothetical protein
MNRSEEDRAIREVVDRLTKQLPQLATEEVTRAVDESRPSSTAARSETSSPCSSKAARRVDCTSRPASGLGR